MTPLIVFTTAWAAGILLVQAALFPPVWLLLALPITLVFGWSWREHPLWRWSPWVCAGLLLGAGRFWLAQPRIDAHHIAAYNGIGQATLTGVVVGEPDRRPTYTNLRLAVEQLTLLDGTTLELGGQVLVKAPPYPRIRYGDRVTATGLLEAPPVFDSFSYKDYLARQHIHSLLRRAEVTTLATNQANPLTWLMLGFKDYALERLLAMLPEPQAALLAGILLGVESGIPDDLNTAFSLTGTSHIVAISGFNITIIAGIFAALARRIGGEKRELPIALTGIWVYTLLVGASAAVVRAAAMGSLAIIARRGDRRLHGPTSLAAAAWLMSLHNPWVLWDVGFLLSFAATAGLIFYTEPLTRLFLALFTRVASQQVAERLVGWFSDALIVTLAAQITTTPIIVAVFGRLSLVTLLTNFLILPFQPAVMICGGVALLTALVWLPLGQLVAWSAWVFLTYTIEMVYLTAQVPWASAPLEHVTLPLVWGYYGLLGGATLWFTASSAQRLVWRDAGLLLARKYWMVGAAGLVLLGAAVLKLPDGRLHVHFLDVGQGDAIFIQTPRGAHALLDGGPEPPRLLSRVGRRMPFWDRRIELVALTGPGDARLAGLIPVLERYQVDYVLSGVWEQREGALPARWAELLGVRPAHTSGTLFAGGRWELDEDVQLEVLWPPEGYAGPLVLRLIYGETSVLLPGAATTVVEESLVGYYGDALRSTALLLPRQGATTCCTPEFLAAVAPEIVIISVGADNRYGNPAPAVLARLGDTPIYRTDQHGCIELRSDGRVFTVRLADK